jgi:hypothetical protein
LGLLFLRLAMIQGSIQAPPVGVHRAGSWTRPLQPAALSASTNPYLAVVAVRIALRVVAGVAAVVMVCHSTAEGRGG